MRWYFSLFLITCITLSRLSAPTLHCYATGQRTRTLINLKRVLTARVNIYTWCSQILFFLITKFPAQWQEPELNRAMYSSVFPLTLTLLTLIWSQTFVWHLSHLSESDIGPWSSHNRGTGPGHHPGGSDLSPEIGIFNIQIIALWLIPFLLPTPNNTWYTRRHIFDKLKSSFI